jgi:hypothetical protein
MSSNVTKGVNKGRVARPAHLTPVRFRRQQHQLQRRATLELERQRREAFYYSAVKVFVNLPPHEKTEDKLQALVMANLEWKNLDNPNGSGVEAPKDYRRNQLHANRPFTYIKDWVSGKIRPRCLTDDFISQMTPRKCSEHIRMLRERRAKAAAQAARSKDSDSGYCTGPAQSSNSSDAETKSL